MKAISIKQPWASLIAHGIKDVENRTWKCPEKYIGQRVLIHASMKSAVFWDNSHEICARVDNFIREISKSGTDWSKYPHSAIIGSVKIVGCVINHPSIWAENSKGTALGGHVIDEKEPIIWNWILAEPILFDASIPAKGKLSFWEFDDELLPKTK